MTGAGVAEMRWPVAAAGVAAAGCAALVLRPVLLEGVDSPEAALVILFLGLLAAGSLWPSTAEGHPRLRGRPMAIVLGLGIGAFLAGRLLGGGHPPLPHAGRFLWLNLLAAVAEEAFFRRLVYSALARLGPAAAVGGSAALFAVVHVTVYGAWVLPLDLAAGLILSWQRWATGSWYASAVTHAVANALVVF